ncbi:MAG: SDR family oxidoreductase [Alphaproteobacteria bacterium]|jgi:NAD(P)-dependent dehydrogenase (short-subunit alcohol dehydrogenase family)|nr:SDR family oxidoreductase [Alphaproteobacteria bacterium]MDP6567228.1 SDR family oxidoreductase [Alphaproteobacteria bacterium]MDP6812944.1 SDR family oxidoreductase [Alphaproteobacteria bacterium]
MHNQTVVITGGSDGIGLDTARQLAGLGASLVIVGRNAEKCARAVAAIQGDGGNGGVDYLVADLSRMSAVRGLAESLLARTPRIDVLVNNAGGLFRQAMETPEGLDHTFALNHLAYFLLTELLLPTMRAAGRGRIVNVASGVHRGVDLDFDDLQSRRNHDGWLSYRRSKLMNVMFTYALARRLADTRITANSLHPGFVRSKFGHNNGGLYGIGLRLSQRLAAISVEAGARTSVHLAAADEVAGLSGRYFEKSREVESSPQSHDQAAQEELWRHSADILAELTQTPRSVPGG